MTRKRDRYDTCVEFKSETLKIGGLKDASQVAKAGITQILIP
jgi:hypothetical protein